MTSHLCVVMTTITVIKLTSCCEYPSSLQSLEAVPPRAWYSQVTQGLIRTKTRLLVSGSSMMMYRIEEDDDEDDRGDDVERLEWQREQQNQQQPTERLNLRHRPQEQLENRLSEQLLKQSGKLPHNQQKDADLRQQLNHRDADNTRVVLIYSRTCLEVVPISDLPGSNKDSVGYLVSHTEYHNSSLHLVQHNPQPTYLCIRFLFRSPDVLQTIESVMADELDTSLCHNASSRLLERLLVDSSRVSRPRGGPGEAGRRRPGAVPGEAGRGHLGAVPGESGRGHPGAVPGEASRGRCALLRGGFSLRVSSKGQRSPCDGSREEEVRMEANCSPESDHLVLRFARASCVPVELFLNQSKKTDVVSRFDQTKHKTTPAYTTTATTLPLDRNVKYMKKPNSNMGGTNSQDGGAIKFSCVADWSDKLFTFLLIRRYGQASLRVLRLPTRLLGLDSAFTAYMFTDLIAPTEIKMTNHPASHLRLDFVRDVPRPVTSLCLDEAGADTCAALTSSRCSQPAGLSCARTCGLCNATRPSICLYPAQLVGEWIRFDAGETLILSQSVLRFGMSGGREIFPDFHCVNWRSSAESAHRIVDSRALDEQEKSIVFQTKGKVWEVMFVMGDENGCRPRYGCARFLEASSHVYYVKFSQSRPWPLTDLPSTPITCSLFQFSSSNSKEDEENQRTYDTIEHYEFDKENMDYSSFHPGVHDNKELYTRQYRLVHRRELRSTVICGFPLSSRSFSVESFQAHSSPIHPDTEVNTRELGCGNVDIVMNTDGNGFVINVAGCSKLLDILPVSHDCIVSLGSVTGPPNTGRGGNNDFSTDTRPSSSFIPTTVQESQSNAVSNADVIFNDFLPVIDFSDRENEILSKSSFSSHGANTEVHRLKSNQNSFASQSSLVTPGLSSKNDVALINDLNDHTIQDDLISDSQEFTGVSRVNSQEEHLNRLVDKSFKNPRPELKTSIPARGAFRNDELNRNVHKTINDSQALPVTDDNFGVRYKAGTIRNNKGSEIVSLHESAQELTDSVNGSPGRLRTDITAGLSDASANATITNNRRYSIDSPSVVAHRSSSTAHVDHVIVTRSSLTSDDLDPIYCWIFSLNEDIVIVTSRAMCSSLPAGQRVELESREHIAVLRRRSHYATGSSNRREVTTRGFVSDLWVRGGPIVGQGLENGRISAAPNFSDNAQKRFQNDDSFSLTSSSNGSQSKYSKTVTSQDDASNTEIGDGIDPRAFVILAIVLLLVVLYIPFLYISR